MTYEVKHFNNFKELKKFNGKLAQDLADFTGTDEWKDHELYLYPSLADYAKYEAYFGEYSEVLSTRGANTPDLLDYVNFTDLGLELVFNANKDTCYFYTDFGKEYVVTTCFGW